MISSVLSDAGVRRAIERAIMKTRYTVALSMIAGAALGGAAIQGLHAQAKPKAYLVTESEVIDRPSVPPYDPALASAMQAAGGLVQENKAAVIGELLRQFDPSYGDDDPIYSPDGEWEYARFERWLIRSGVPAWPRLESGALDVSGDAFELMCHVPGVEGLHALRNSVGFIAKARLPIGRDGRNRPSLFPFGTANGSNANITSPYNAHDDVRSFIVI